MQNKIFLFILIWFFCLVAIIIKNWNRQKDSVGFVVIYIFCLSLIHFIPAFVYLFPGHWYIHEEWMFKGFREATYGVVAFTIGNLIFANLFISSKRVSAYNAEYKNKLINSKLPKRYFYFGLISYYILSKLFIRFPTFDAIISAAQQLIVVGVCLNCWQAWQQKNKRRFVRWIIFSFLFPFLNIVMQGFIGFGTIMLLIVLLFCAKFFQPKWKLLFIGIFLIYFGMSFYLTYMREKAYLRSMFWADESRNISKRIALFWNSFKDMEWFNPFNLEHLLKIDERMNQNLYIGAVVDYIGRGKINYAGGKTIYNAFLALIPRAIWKEKPIYAGGSELVSKYTGLEFSEGASIAIGQVMEFYINFSSWGVIIGFLILGIFVAKIDTMTGYYLAIGNLKKFICWFLPAISFLLIEASLATIFASIGAGIFIAYLLTLNY